MKEPLKYYAQQKEKFTGKLLETRKKLKLLSAFRLFNFAAALLFLYLYFRYDSIYLIGIAGVSGVLFFYLVKQYEKAKGKKAILQALLEINNKEQKALKGDFSQFPNGEEYLDPVHPYAHDLDLFGASSLFQYLNRAGSVFGKETLATLMQQPPLHEKEIVKRQEAVKELANKADWRQLLQAKALLTPDTAEDKQRLVEWIQQPVTLANGKLYRVLFIIIPILTFSMLFLLISGTVSFFYFLVYLLVPLGIVGLHGKKFIRQYQAVSSSSDLIRKYSSLIQHLEEEPFSSPWLKELQGKLEKDNVKASEITQKLLNIINSLDQQTNPFIFIIFNSIYLRNLYLMNKLGNWQRAYKDNLGHWFSVLGEIESCASLANLAFNRPGFTFPEVIKNNEAVRAAKIGHPLLFPEGERVDNDFSINTEGNFMIITGANMAGKSTFLRTTGVNLVLARMGAPVCAEKLSFYPMKLFTGMRTTDSLQKHESYFFAELKRLKMIIDRLKQGEELFIILDEILKGTNSRDKEQGSKLFVEQLIKLNASGIIATHDLSLCTLHEKFPAKIQNMSFEVEMQHDELNFDYLLRQGICQNMNASFLMRKMGIVAAEKPG